MIQIIIRWIHLSSVWLSSWSGSLARIVQIQVLWLLAIHATILP